MFFLDRATQLLALVSGTSTYYGGVGISADGVTFEVWRAALIAGEKAILPNLFNVWNNPDDVARFKYHI